MCVKIGFDPKVLILIVFKKIYGNVLIIFCNCVDVILKDYAKLG